MKYTITGAMVESLSVPQLLQEIEQDYGCALVVDVKWWARSSPAFVGMIYIDFLHDVERREYNDFPKQGTILLSTKVMELEKQVKFALMLWESTLDTHMR